MNSDGGRGDAPDLLVWSGALPKRRLVLQDARGGAVLPGPGAIWAENLVRAPSSVVTAEDVDVWPYSVGLLVEWVSFLGTLH